MLWITTPPLQNIGTCYINNLNCNNINIPSNGIITREYATSVTDVSYAFANTIYRQHLTVPDCGVYMYVQYTGQYFYLYPIFFTIPDYTNFFNGVPEDGSSIDTTSGIGGTGGYGLYKTLDIADIDDAYLVQPGYGIIVHNQRNFIGGHMINYENTKDVINLVSSTSGNNNKGASIQVYYKGIEQLQP
jgi:hypothetical protein